MQRKVVMNHVNNNIIIPSGDVIKAIQIYNIDEFLRLNFPEREFILDPIIPTQGIVMLYAARGVGKTFLALSMACAIAGGYDLLKWKSPKPRKVLYIDGEMSAQTMQDRLAGVMRGVLDKPTYSISPNNLQILNVTSQRDFSLDLSTKEDQQALEYHLKGIDLLIIDNLSTLTSVKENEADSWLDVQQWLIKLRQRDVSTLLVHHAGKGGAQRGTSRKEDILDTVIALKKSSDYTPEKGAKFSVLLEKCRGFSGNEAKPFEATLFGNTETGFDWMNESLEDIRISTVIELSAMDLSIREIAEEVGISKSSVHRILQKMKQS